MSANTRPEDVKLDRSVARLKDLSLQAVSLASQEKRAKGMTGNLAKALQLYKENRLGQVFPFVPELQLKQEEVQTRNTKVPTDVQALCDFDPLALLRRVEELEVGWFPIQMIRVQNIDYIYELAEASEDDFNYRHQQKRTFLSTVNSALGAFGLRMGMSFAPAVKDWAVSVLTARASEDVRQRQLRPKQPLRMLDDLIPITEEARCIEELCGFDPHKLLVTIGGLPLPIRELGYTDAPEDAHCSLPTSTVNTLQDAGVTHTYNLVIRTEDELREIPGFGRRKLHLAKKSLEALGLDLGMKLDPRVRNWVIATLLVSQRPPALAVVS